MNERIQLTLSSLLLAALASCGSDASDPFGRAVELQNAGKYGDAIRAYDALLVDDSEHAGALYNRGVCRIEVEDTAGAVADFTEVLELGSGESGPDADLDALLWRGTAHLASGDADRAARDFEAVLAIEPLALEARLLRADAHAASGDVEAALAGYDIAIRTAPDDSAAYDRKAALLNSIGEVEAAEAEASLGATARWLAEHPDDVNAMVRRGVAFLLVGEAELAELDLGRAVELGATEPEVLTALAQAQALSGMDAEALDTCTRVIDEPDHTGGTSGALFLRADLYLGAGAYAQAAADFEAVRSGAKPAQSIEWAQASAKLARLRSTCPEAELRDATEALELAAAALAAYDARVSTEAPEGDPERWFYLDTHALALAVSNQFSAARDVQSEAVEAAPESQRAPLMEMLELYRAGASTP